MVKRRVIRAIKSLIGHEVFLLRNNVNERSISHKFAEYLQDEFPDWHVDCEYNRDHDVKKQLNVPTEVTRRDDTEAKTVFPDIIIHHRNTSENLLVVEVKKSSNTDGDDWDRKKLVAFVRPPFNYRYGVFVKFTTGSSTTVDYNLEWFRNDQASASTATT